MPQVSLSTSRAISVTPNDTTPVVADKEMLRLWVGGAGNVAVRTIVGDNITFLSVGAGVYIDVRFTHILATGTTATNMVALYD